MIVVVVLTLFLAFKQFIALVDILHFYRFHKRKTSKVPSVPKDNPTVIVVIPALLEQHIIAETVSYFSAFRSIQIVIVTTEREEKLWVLPSTAEVLAGLAPAFSFVRVHFPYRQGTKADQLNYVAMRFSELLPMHDAQNSFFAIYDADSRPHPRTFDQFILSYASNRDRNIFQQSSVFYENYDSLGSATTSKILKAFLRAQAVLQTRFTVAYEIPRLLNQLEYYNKKLTWRSALGSLTYAHCVGHGLFVRVSFLQRVNFPAGSSVEDMFYGFILNCLNEPITPIPILTNSEMPSTLSTLFFQRTRWFLGPARFLTYLKYVRANYSHLSSLTRCVVVSAFCFHNALNWALTSPIYLLINLAVLYTMASILIGRAGAVNWVVLFASFLVTLFYLVGLVLLLRNFSLTITFAGQAQKRTTPRRHGFGVILTFPLVLLLHSIPAYYCIFSMLFGKAQIQYSKTDRS